MILSGPHRLIIKCELNTQINDTNTFLPARQPSWWNELSRWARRSNAWLKAVAEAVCQLIYGYFWFRCYFQPLWGNVLAAAGGFFWKEAPAHASTAPVTHKAPCFHFVTLWLLVTDSSCPLLGLHPPTAPAPLLCLEIPNRDRAPAKYWTALE